MKGLVLKEVYTLIQYWKLYLIYVLVFGGISIFTGQASFAGAMSGVMVFTLPISTFSIDEQCGWNRMALAMPLSRKQVVGGKYIITMLMVAISIAVQLVSMVVVAVIGKFDPLDFLLGMLGSTVGVLVVMMVVLPFIFKYGSDKGRMIMMLAFAGFFIFIMALSVFDDLGGALTIAPEVLALIMVAAAIASVFVSYFVSCHIYSRKEF